MQCTANDEATEMAARNLGKRVLQLRRDMGISQRELARRSGISFSAVSKIENNQLSPTYDSLLQLAIGFNCDIIDLFTDPPPQAPLGRRSITRKGKGLIHLTKTYSYEMLCNDIAYKKMIPLRVEIQAKSIYDFEKLPKHEGEEVIFVISGTIEVYTEFYHPEVLQAGDCIYFDSSMEHACINKGDTKAEVFWICSSSSVEERIRAI